MGRDASPRGAHKHYTSDMEFFQAIPGFFKVTLPKHWKSIRDTVSDDFHIIRPEDCRVGRSELYNAKNVIAHVVGSAGPDQATANFPPMRSRMACSAG
jgi:hypothetical protein